MQSIRILNCPYSRKKKKKFLKAIKHFINSELIGVPVNLIVDFKGALKTSRKTYYQGLINLYDLQSKVCDISLNYFIEFDNLNDSRDCLWGVFHELIHVKQIHTKELVIDPSGEKVSWRGEVYEKLPFRYSHFDSLLKKDRKLATRYHMDTIPWEVEPYTKSDLYTGIKSFV